MVITSEVLITIIVLRNYYEYVFFCCVETLEKLFSGRVKHLKLLIRYTCHFSVGKLNVYESIGKATDDRLITPRIKISLFTGNNTNPGILFFISINEYKLISILILL